MAVLPSNHSSPDSLCGGNFWALSLRQSVEEQREEHDNHFVPIRFGPLSVVFVSPLVLPSPVLELGSESYSKAKQCSTSAIHHQWTANREIFADRALETIDQRVSSSKSSDHSTSGSWRLHCTSPRHWAAVAWHSTRSDFSNKHGLVRPSSNSIMKWQISHWY